MQKLQFNQILFLFILVAHHSAMYTMQSNQQLNSIKNFPQQKNHNGGKVTNNLRSQNLGDRLKNRFLTELPKPIQFDANILLMSNHTHNNCSIDDNDFLEWIENKKGSQKSL